MDENGSIYRTFQLRLQQIQEGRRDRRGRGEEDEGYEGRRPAAEIR